MPGMNIDLNTISVTNLNSLNVKTSEKVKKVKKNEQKKRNKRIQGKIAELKSYIVDCENYAERNALDLQIINDLDENFLLLEDSLDVISEARDAIAEKLRKLKINMKKNEKLLLNNTKMVKLLKKNIQQSWNQFQVNNQQSCSNYKINLILLMQELNRQMISWNLDLRLMKRLFHKQKVI